MRLCLKFFYYSDVEVANCIMALETPIRVIRRNRLIKDKNNILLISTNYSCDNYNRNLGSLYIFQGFIIQFYYV